jgi:hypothetical protein
MKFKALIAIIALLVITGTAFASSGGGFVLDWFRIGGSGETMSGSGFSLTGTVGQAEAGAMSGGGYSLAGGFFAEAGTGGGKFKIFLPVVLKNL